MVLEKIPTFEKVKNYVNGSISPNSVDSGSVTADDLEATNSITDPSGNEVTNFSNLGGTVKYNQSNVPSNPKEDEIWFDTSVGIYFVYSDTGDGLKWNNIVPFQDTQEFSTFTESDLSYIGSLTSPDDGSFGPSKTELVAECSNHVFTDSEHDNTERGARDLTASGWRLQYAVDSGIQSQENQDELEVNVSGSAANVRFVRETEIEQGIEVTVRENLTAGDDDGRIRLEDNSGRILAELEYYHVDYENHYWSVYSNSTRTKLANSSKENKFKIVPDFNTKTCDIYANDEFIIEVDFEDSNATGVKEFSVNCGTDSGYSTDYYIGKVTCLPKSPEGFGIIQWSQGNEDVESYETLSSRINDEGESYSLDIMEKSSNVVIQDFESGVGEIPSPFWEGFKTEKGYNPDPDYTSYFVATDENPISGNYSGELYTDSENATLRMNYKDGVTKDNFKFDFRIDDKTTDQYDEVKITSKGADGEIGNIIFKDTNSEFVKVNGTEIMSSWTVEKIYNIEFDWDFQNNDFGLTINGSDYGRFDFVNPVDGFKQLQIESSSEYNRSVYIDNITCTGLAEKYTNIPENFDISQISPEENIYVRFKYMRQNLNNRPHLDYLARRIIR